MEHSIFASLDPRLIEILSGIGFQETEKPWLFTYLGHEFDVSAMDPEKVYSEAIRFQEKVDLSLITPAGMALLRRAANINIFGIQGVGRVVAPAAEVARLLKLGLVENRVVRLNPFARLFYDNERLYVTAKGAAFLFRRTTY